MASARLIFSRGIPKQIGPIVVDVFQSEDHNRTSTTTNYSVENGADITDHIRNDPIQISITGHIEAIGDGSNILRVNQQLNELMDNKELITVVTGLKVYENMHIQNYSVSRNKQNGGSLPISMSFQQITKVQSQAVAISISQISIADEETNKQAQGAADVGKATSGQTQKEGEDNFLADIEAQVEGILGSVEDWK